MASKDELGLGPESRPKQSGGYGEAEEQKARQSVTLVDSTCGAVEVVELIVDFARVGTVVVRVCGAGSAR